MNMCLRKRPLFHELAESFRNMMDKDIAEQYVEKNENSCGTIYKPFNGVEKETYV